MMYNFYTIEMPLNQEKIEIETFINSIFKNILRILKFRKFKGKKSFSKNNLDDIFEKDLLMALPFFIMKYEKELQSIASNSDKKEVFLNEFRELMIRLKNSDIIIDHSPSYPTSDPTEPSAEPIMSIYLEFEDF